MVSRAEKRIRIKKQVVSFAACNPGPLSDQSNLNPGTVRDGVTSCDWARTQHSLQKLTMTTGSVPAFPSETLVPNRTCLECLKVFSGGMLFRRLAKIIHI